MRRAKLLILCVAALIAMSFGTTKARAQDNIVTSVQCYHLFLGEWANLYPVVTDGNGDFTCQQTEYSNNDFIELSILGHCQNDNIPAADSYAFATNCKYGPYELVVSGSASFWTFDDYTCGVLVDESRLGFVLSRGSVFSPIGTEQLSTSWQQEDCDGTPDGDSPGTGVMSSDC